MLVCKFGGSVLPDAQGYLRAREAVNKDPKRRVIVISAPGKSSVNDDKITDLLYACQSAAADGRGFQHIFDRVAARFRAICNDLHIADIDAELREAFRSIKAGASPALAASRGEYLSAKVMSRLLGFSFVDAKDVIRFDGNGELKREKTAELIRAKLKDLPGVVVPGFYGADEKGNIHAFMRGGSDVTAALIASALRADACENFKDVRGVYAADPRHVPSARIIPEMTYSEVQMLSRLGANVLCEAAVKPLQEAGVALCIRALNAPDHPGTRISNVKSAPSSALLTAVTGRAGLTLVRSEQGAKDSVYRYFDGAGAVSLVEAAGPLPRLTGENACIVPRAALLAAVGEGMERAGSVARLCFALSSQGVRVYDLHQGVNGGCVCAVIDENDLPRAIRAVYDSFLRT